MFQIHKWSREFVFPSANQPLFQIQLVRCDLAFVRISWLDDGFDFVMVKKRRQPFWFVNLQFCVIIANGWSIFNGRRSACGHHSVACFEFPKCLDVDVFHIMQKWFVGFDSATIGHGVPRLRGFRGWRIRGPSMIQSIG